MIKRLPPRTILSRESSPVSIDDLSRKVETDTGTALLLYLGRRASEETLKNQVAAFFRNSDSLIFDFNAKKSDPLHQTDTYFRVFGLYFTAFSKILRSASHSHFRSWSMRKVSVSSLFSTEISICLRAAIG